MTQYIYQLSVAVPEGLTEQANHLAAYLGGGEADLATYQIARFTDGETNYHFLATVVTAAALTKVAAPSNLPEFVDGALLMQALSSLTLVHADAEELPTASPEGIVAIIGLGPQQAITTLGLSPIDQEAN